jgi:hypothetical protein
MGILPLICLLYMSEKVNLDTHYNQKSREIQGDIKEFNSSF